jgi:hypothetical protein
LHDDNDFCCIEFFYFTETDRQGGIIIWRLECGVFVLPVRWIEFYWAFAEGGACMCIIVVFLKL